MTVVKSSNVAVGDPSPVPHPAPAATGLSAVRLIALLAAALSLGNATWAAWDQDITYDESFHLRWPERLLTERDDRRDEFRFDSKTPAMLPAVLIRDALQEAGVESPQALRFSTRLPSLACLVAALALVATISRTANPLTAWIGVLLAALDPNLAAHASIATTDAAYTVVVLALAAVLSRFRPTWAFSLRIGALVGTALAVKYTAVLLLPVAAIVMVAGSTGPPGRRLGLAAAAMAAACLTTSVFYLGVGVFEPLGRVPLETPALRTLAGALPALPLPVPRSILTGIDASMAHNEPTRWASYIFGQEHHGGVWYYFVATWFMKTPVGLLLLVLFGLFGLRRHWRARAILIPGAVLLIHLGYLSFFFATQIGLRFALPCIALACALAARGLGGAKSRWLMAAAALALVERAPYWEDPIAFTNLVVWPKSRAYWFTADSNLDYGQNRGRVARYAKETGLALVMDQPVPTPGWYVTGANDLVIFDSRRTRRWLIEHDIPAINVGFSHFAFGITGEMYDRYLTEVRSTVSVPNFEDACGGPLTHYPPGSQIPFTQIKNPKDERRWVVCVTSRKGVDIGFTVNAGRIGFGRVTMAGGCESDMLEARQQSWFRIPAGARSQLCIQELALRRSYLSYEASGYLTVRGQGAEVEVKPVLAVPPGADEPNPPVPK